MIESLGGAIGSLLTWPGPLWLVIGVLAGIAIGILPGVGGASGTALMIPLTLGMSPSLAIGFLLAVNSCAGLGGQMASILVNIPGTPPNAATTLDGYPMTRAGRAAEAIGAATLASIVGAYIGVVFLIALLPVARETVLAFSYPEFFMVAVMGLVLIASLTEGNTFKGLLSAGVGLMIAMIGLDPVVGSPRFTFGQLYLWDGIGIVPAIVGLFAGTELLMLYTAGKPIRIEEEANKLERPPGYMDGFIDVVRHWATVLKSSVIGFGLGVVPGIGGTIGSFVAYGRAARSSGHPERYGKGEVDGLIAVESSNDADNAGALLPTIAFGIPGGASMAVLLAALILHGVPIGPNLLRGDQEILLVIIVSLIVPRTLGAALVLLIGKQVVAITRVPGRILAPSAGLMALMGVYAIRNEILDVVVTLGFAYLGWAMNRYGFSRIALVIALVLGALVEIAFHQTIGAFGLAGFFTRPIALVMFGITVLALVGPVVYRQSGRLQDLIGRWAGRGA